MEGRNLKGVVNLQARTCSCKVFDLDQYPCDHCLTTCRARNIFLTTCVHVIIHEILIVQLIWNQFILFWINNCGMLQMKCVIVLFFPLQMVADMLVGQARNVYHHRARRLEDVDVAFFIPLDAIDKVVGANIL